MIKYLTPLFLAVLAAILSTVFITDDFLWQGVTTAKYFWFAAAMCLVAIIVPFILFRKGGGLRISDVGVGLLVVYICINYFLLNRWPDMRWWLFLLLIPLYVAVRVASESENMRRWLLDAVLAVVLLEAIWGLLQLYGFAYSHHSLYKITGSLFNPGPYSGFVAVGVPLGLGYSMDKKLPGWERWLGGITLVSVLLVLPAAMSRAAWIAAIVGSIPVVIFQVSDFKFQVLNFRLKRPVRILAIVSLCVIAVGMLAGLYFLKKDSADGRWLIWRVSTEAVEEHPLLGAGYGRFAAVYGDAQAAHFLDSKGTDAQIMVADSPEYAFNEYVQMAVELGVVGLILFLLVIASLAVTCHSSLITCHPSLVTILVFATFSYPFSVLPLCILFVFLLAIAVSSSRPLSLKSRSGTDENQANSQFSILNSPLLKMLVVVVCICVTAYSAYHILPKRQAYHEWSSLQTLYNSGVYKAAAKEYTAYYPLLKHEKQFLFEYGQCLSKTGQYEESNRVFEQFLHYSSDPMVYNCMGNNFKAAGDYSKAEGAYIHASQIVPNRHYPMYLLMKLYQETGQPDKAKETAHILLNKPVKVKSTAIREILEEARKMKNEE